MYEYIRGTLIDLNPQYAVIDVNGVGYKVMIAASHFGKMPQIQEKVFLYTSFVIRENSQALFGFLTKQERDLYEMLLGLSGIGPKTALSLIGHLDFGTLIQAVHSNDITSIIRVPGVGRKTAERLIVDLRGKLDEFLVESCKKSEEPVTILLRDATAALVNLGYSSSAASKAVKAALEKKPEKSDLSTIITLALQS